MGGPHTAAGRNSGTLKKNNLYEEGIWLGMAIISSKTWSHLWLLQTEHARGPLRPRSLFWLWLAVEQITPKLSDIKQLFIVPFDSMGQESPQCPVGMVHLCSMMSGASAGRLEAWGHSKACSWNHKTCSLTGLAVDASCQLAPLLGW